MPPVTLTATRTDIDASAKRKKKQGPATISSSMSRLKSLRSATKEFANTKVLSSSTQDAPKMNKKRTESDSPVDDEAAALGLRTRAHSGVALGRTRRNKRPRASPEAVITTNASSEIGSSSRIRAFPFELRLRTLRLKEDKDQGLLAIAEVGHAAGALKPDDVPVDYVLVLDKSGSMQGARSSNMLEGLRALLQLLPMMPSGGASDVTLVAFDHQASTIYGPGPAAGALERWDAIADALKAGGNTSIEEALRVALKVADAKLQSGRAVVMLVLTDGDDRAFARNVECFREGRHESIPHTSAAVLAQLGSRSGLAAHFVGICSDADAPLLDGLAQLSLGTFVSISDHDIKGLMGSLLGLVMEKLNHGALLSVAMEEEAGLVMERPIHLRIGTPTLVPLELRNTTARNVVLKLELLPIGAKLGSTNTAATSATTTVVVTKTVALAAQAAGDQDWDVALEHGRMWRGEAGAAIAQAMSTLRHDPAASAAATARHTGLLGQMRRVVHAARGKRSPAAKALRALLAEMEAQGAKVVAARDNYQLMRQLSARCISDASTARNGGISIGDSRYESAGQSDMRSLSMEYY